MQFVALCNVGVLFCKSGTISSVLTNLDYMFLEMCNNMQSQTFVTELAVYL